jgi:lysozyme family protein
MTVAATTAKPSDEVIEAFCNLREAHFKSLSTFATFGKGWMNRLGSVEAESKHMA